MSLNFRSLDRQKPVMRMGWHHLLFLHWPVPIEALRTLVPHELEIDTYKGQAYIGLVPFTMTRVRPRPLPGLPFAPRLYENFHETNVRTYVRHGDTNGVWFFSLDAAALLPVIAARCWFYLPYYWSKMRVLTARQAHNGLNYRAIYYQTHRKWPAGSPVSCNIKALVEEQPPQPATLGSLEEFLVERYFLFSRHNGQLWRGRVAHRPYQLQKARVEHLYENLVLAAGVTRPALPPHVLYAHDVRVEAFAPYKLNPN